MTPAHAQPTPLTPTVSRELFRSTIFASSTVNVTVPNGTITGDYYVLACADDRGAVLESSETNNCAATSKTVKVQASGGNRPGPHAFR